MLDVARLLMMPLIRAYFALLLSMRALRKMSGDDVDARQICHAASLRRVSRRVMIRCQRYVLLR